MTEPPSHPGDEILSLYHDGEGVLEILRDVEEHLRDCAECRERLRKMRDLSREIRELPLLSAPASIIDKVRQGMAAAPPRAVMRPVGINVWLGRIAALLLIGAIVFALYQVRDDLIGSKDDSTRLARNELPEDFTAKSADSALGAPDAPAESSPAAATAPSDERLGAANEDASIPAPVGEALGDRFKKETPAVGRGRVQGEKRDAAAATAASVGKDGEADGDGKLEKKEAGGQELALEQKARDEEIEKDAVREDARKVDSASGLVAIEFLEVLENLPVPDGTQYFTFTLDRTDVESIEACRQGLVLMLGDAGANTDATSSQLQLPEVSAVAIGARPVTEIPPAGQLAEPPSEPVGTFDATLTEEQFATLSTWARDREQQEAREARRSRESAGGSAARGEDREEAGLPSEAKKASKDKAPAARELEGGLAGGTAQGTVRVRIILLQKRVP